MTENIFRAALTNPITNDYYKEGEIVIYASLGKTLRRIAKARDPSYSFYKGDIAKEIVKEFAAGNGIIKRADLTSYSSAIQEPLVAKIKVCKHSSERTCL